MAKATLADQMEMLRVQLETALPTPLLLVVSSARDDDGKDLVASGLARSMDAAGYATLLVLADERRRHVDGAPEPKSVDEICEFGIAPFLVRRSRASLPLMVLSGDRIRHTVSRESFARFAQTCRGTYQVTIIEAATSLANSFTMFAAVAADGVLLTVREGRRVRAEDRQLAKALAREKAPLLGIVAVNASAIRNAPAEPAVRAAPAKARSAGAGVELRREEHAV